MDIFVLRNQNSLKLKKKQYLQLTYLIVLFQFLMCILMLIFCNQIALLIPPTSCFRLPNVIIFSSKRLTKIYAKQGQVFKKKYSDRRHMTESYKPIIRISSALEFLRGCKQKYLRKKIKNMFFFLEKFLILILHENGHENMYKIF